MSDKEKEIGDNDEKKNAIDTVFTFNEGVYNKLSNHQKIDLISILMNLVHEKIKELGSKEPIENTNTMSV